MPELSQLVSSDSRPPLHRMRRDALVRLAKTEGIAHDPQAPATTLVALLESLGVDPLRPDSGQRWAQVQQQEVLVEHLQVSQLRRFIEVLVRLLRRQLKQ